MEDNNDNVLPETREFAGLFSSSIKKREKIIPWDDSEYVGLSILKDYPDKSSFIPARNKKNNKDSVALIKIGYSIRAKQESKDNKVPLIVKIHLASKYLLHHHFINKDDGESPTEESLKESKASPQPSDLEESSRYYLLINKKKIIDIKTNKYIKPANLVENIYQDHLNTLTNLQFRIKMWYRNCFLSSIEPSLKIIIMVNKVLFGKEVKIDKNDFVTGKFEAYKHTDLSEDAKSRVTILGSTLPITYQTARFFFIVTTILFLINYYRRYDLFGVVALFDAANKNSLFIVSLITTLLFFLDNIAPHVLLFIANQLVRFRLHLWQLRIKLS